MPARKKVIKFFLLAIIFISIGCESSQWFQSEGKLKRKIQGTWKRQFLTFTDYEEDWIFREGALNIERIKNNITSPIDSGSYNVDAKLTAAYVWIEGLSADSSLIEYNRKWTIVECSDDVLYLVTDGSKGSILQREFSRKE